MEFIDNNYEFEIDLELQYTNNKEYRECIRKLFKIDSSKYSEETKEKLNDPDLDDETRDELEYDEESALAAMDWIFDKTRKNPLFQKIFESAAAKMLSSNYEIGFAVLMSYDYLVVFHNCLKEFLKNPVGFNESNPAYLTVLAKL
jgi:hypothetical protein